MQKCRGSVAVISCKGFIYAVGGYELSTTNKNAIKHDDGERYDPRCNQWTLMVSFSRPKEGLGIAAINSKLYIIGGFTSKIINEMEEYDTETNRWRKVERLKYCLTFDKAIVLSFQRSPLTIKRAGLR